jgi:ketosteroid isomerase-like protein
MTGEDNVAICKAAYVAFQEGDVESAMEAIADDVEWITPGRSAVSGTRRGKREVGELWARFAEKGFRTQPEYWFSDETRVVVLTQISLEGEPADTADVVTLKDGKVVKFQSALDTALLERVFGRA